MNAGCHVIRRLLRSSNVLKTNLNRRCMCYNPTIKIYHEVDIYNGVSVKLDAFPLIEPVDFHHLLTESLARWQSEGRIAVWLHVPIEQSSLISGAAKQGFTFHHAEDKDSVLCLWLSKTRPNILPRFATHQVGVAGVVLREDTNEVLVVQDKARKHTLWKFPGGLSDLQEDISLTAVREVFEETGVKTEFKSILTFRQQHNHPGAFGRSDLYFLCRLQPLTFELKPCSIEILKCKWMSLEELENQEVTSDISRNVVEILNYGLKNGFDNVDLEQKEYKSFFKGLTYKMYKPKILTS